MTPTGKHILITTSFQKRLKKLKRHFSEDDVVANIADFIHRGLRKGETILTRESFGAVTIVIVKCRIRKRQSVGRYLLGVIHEQEYLPIFLDLKTGIYGKNLSFQTNSCVVSMLNTALVEVLTDYLKHTDATPRLTRYTVDEPERDT